MAAQYDVVIVGAGPGGYIGAIRAAQLGLKTAVIEKDKTLGGTCLNVGCIPSKALLESSEHYSMALHELKSHGVQVGDVKLDLKTMMERKSKIVSDLTGGVAFLFKKNGIDSIGGKGRLVSATQIEVSKSDGSKEIVSAKNIILATGSVPNDLPGLKWDGRKVITSTEALALEKVPAQMIVIGGGVIGLELGSVWSRLGSEVTVIEYAANICGSMDQGIAKRLLMIMKKQGLKFHMESRVTGTELKGDRVTVHFEGLKDGAKQTLEGDVVLVSAGRKPYSEGLGLEELGIRKDKRGVVEVDDHFQTSLPGVYAIGDLIRGPMLAHKAEEEGVAVAELLAGKPGHVNYEACPNVVYTWPEVATVGASEEDLKAKGIAYKSGVFMFAPNGRAKTMGFTEGQVKILADAKSDRLLGVHILGPRASDMIAEAVIAMEFGGSAEDLARSFHAHPTLSEVMREAALAVDKRAREA